MIDRLDIDQYHREHAFTLPKPGELIVSPLTGTTYEIGAQFHEGNFGHVFACTDEWPNELVAKVLKPEPNWQQSEAKAVSEGLAMAISRSPNIVHVYDMFVFRGAYFIISERCHESVRDMINDKTANPRVWLPALAQALLNALHGMHVNGIAHCDVHPGNVFLRFVKDAILPDEIRNTACAFKLGDLGLARPIENMHVDGTFLNSFRPPEAIDQKEFGPLDYRSDIYQAGLTLLMFATKQAVVFSRDDILQGRPREMAEALPFRWAEPLAAMLRRHVEFRPPTAIDAWRSLKPHLVSQ